MVGRVTVHPGATGETHQAGIGIRRCRGLRSGEPWDQSRIRNFSIIAHIDHGKSTLADRILQLSESVSEREMRDQLLDSMDPGARARHHDQGQAVRVHWKGHELNLIDTPGHVDFTYEVSRSLQACEARCWSWTRHRGSRPRHSRTPILAIENDLENRPGGEQDRPSRPPTRMPRRPRYAAARRRAGGGHPRLREDRRETSTRCSTRFIERIPAPEGDAGAPARALVFDSSYDQYRGVIAFVRVVDGRLRTGAA